MEIRKALLDDIESIMVVIEDAQKLLKNEGVDQWQDGFPNVEILARDIENWESFVLEENGEVLGFFSVAFEEDEGYKRIYDGEWVKEESYYGTIHRTAISSKVRGRGLSKYIFDFCEALAKSKKAQSIRIDTHEDNTRMRYIIEKNKFIYCGHIFLALSGSKRLVYEKLI